MGGGYWNVTDYTTRATEKASSGRSTFDYHDSTYSRPRSTWKVHKDLDPAKLNTFDKKVREAFDSDEHPNATPIAVFFDVTGSMGQIPRVLQKKLPQLHGLLQRKGYVEDPQILFGGVGDGYSDTLPLQVGQFESDSRGDAQMEHMVLEGGGGGGNHESYELAAYFMARHSKLDCVEKRGKKGYLFFIGDERIYSKVNRKQVEKIIGDKLQEDLSTVEVFEELKRQYEVFFLFAAQGSYEPGDVLDKSLPTRSYHYSDGSKNVCYWRDLLGQNALVLDDAKAVCETIALTLGIMEGTVSLDEGLDDLREIGADKSSVKAAGKALAKVGAATSSSAVVSGTLPATGGASGSSRI